VAGTITIPVPTADWKDLGLRIELCWRLSLGGPGSWGATISRRRLTASDKEGKPERIITLLHDESPAELLRQIATLLEHDGSIPVTEAKS
jgi:hypothetical protein